MAKSTPLKKKGAKKTPKKMTKKEKEEQQAVEEYKAYYATHKFLNDISRRATGFGFFSKFFVNPVLVALIGLMVFTIIGLIKSC